MPVGKWKIPPRQQHKTKGKKPDVANRMIGHDQIRICSVE